MFASYLEQSVVMQSTGAPNRDILDIWKDIKLPDGKLIVPGLISQSTNVVEHPELVAWRIKHFARLVGHSLSQRSVTASMERFA